MVRALSVLALAGALSLAAVAWAADEEISRDKTASSLSAFSPLAAWSRQDIDGTYRLAVRERVATLLVQPPPRDLAIRSSDSPFDPDVGKSKRGVLLVAYTRCAGVSREGCDVYQFDGKRESKVKGASSSSCSEFAPSIWNGTVAFGRTGPGTCRGLYVTGERGTAFRLDKRVPADTDIRAGKVAYLHIPARGDSVIRIFTIKKGRSQIVVAGTRGEGEGVVVSNPTFAGRYVYWLLEDRKRHDFTVGRSRGSRRSTLQWSDRSLPGSIDSIALDGRMLFYINGRGVHEANDPVPIFGSRD
jgi:hypothetical protein